MRIIAEILGTYFLIFAGCGSVVVNADKGVISFPGITIVWGLVVMVMVYSLGHISGAHFNPAVTIAFATCKRFPWTQVPTYVVAQVVGSTLASGTLVSASNQELYFDWHVSFREAAPLGVAKQIIVINDQFPGPLFNATTNDVVNINIHNNLDEPFLMTWNGIQMRRNSWQDGVRETNCPINPGQNWTYSFQLKDQVGSFFYFTSLLFHKAAGGYGAIRIQNSETVPVPFPKADYDYEILIGDWYNTNHRVLRSTLENNMELPLPDGVVINGLGPHQASMDF